MATQSAVPAEKFTYYDASAAERTVFPALRGQQSVDVCIIGGGIAGCSTALHLKELGFRVALLEANRIGWGASGLNGGQIIPGFAIDQSKLDSLVGKSNAMRMWELSVAAIDLLRGLIQRHSIACDWTPGHMQVAIKARQLDALHAWHTTLLQDYRYASTRLLDKAEIQSQLATSRYCGGLHDSNGGHLHPLNYVLGLAAAAASTGVQIFEHSAATEIEQGALLSIKTLQGTIRASQLVVCGGAYLGNLVPTTHKRILPVATYVIATEQLGEARAVDLIRDNSAIADTNFILDYFRRSADHRLLFGGRVSYAGRDTAHAAIATRRHMLKIFPQLAATKIDYAWGGLIDITMNRAPDFGRLAPNIYYLQGFSGHGVALATLSGKLVADAIAGQAERFDLFDRIPHRHFPGGSLLRRQTLSLAMLWYRLRDLL